MKKISIGRVILDTLNTGILTFVGLMIYSLIIRVVFLRLNIQESLSDIISFFVLFVINALAFFFSHIKISLKHYKVNKNELFSLKRELLNYIKNEGKYFLLVYGILAIVY